MNHQAEDRKAHLAYFDPDSQLSFVWNGTKGQTVDVCHGGYGEPVTATLELTFHPDDMSFKAGLKYFESECKQFVKRNAKN